MLEILLPVLIVCLTLYFQRSKTDRGKILNVYSEPGKWYLFKFCIFYTLLWLRRQKAKLQNPIPDEELETMKTLSSHKKAFDATFFHAVAQHGIYICGGIERRHGAKANCLLYIAVPELGLLESPKLPKTYIDADPVCVLLQKEYAAGGIYFAMESPMTRWRFAYKGKMRLHKNPEITLDVELDGEWTSELPYFLFERDVHLSSLVKAIAREPWTSEFFTALKTAHQTHYEQMGHYKGTLTIDNRTYALDMAAFRDHSYGFKRDWALMHRYIFHMLYLEDDTRVSVGVVSQPATTSVLEMGYIVLPDKTLHPITDLDLVLYQHGEGGLPPNDYAFTFHAANTLYTVQISVRYQSTHFKGNDIEAKLIERFITCKVNGRKGHGISEWHYNNLK